MYPRVVYRLKFVLLDHRINRCPRLRKILCPDLHRYLRHNHYHAHHKSLLLRDAHQNFDRHNHHLVRYIVQMEDNDRVSLHRIHPHLHPKTKVPNRHCLQFHRSCCRLRHIFRYHRERLYYQNHHSLCRILHILVVLHMLPCFELDLQNHLHLDLQSKCCALPHQCAHHNCYRFRHRFR